MAERTALLDAATAAQPDTQSAATPAPLVTQDAAGAAAGALGGQSSAPAEPAKPEAAAPAPAAEAAPTGADTSADEGEGDDDAAVTALLKDVTNPFKDGVEQQTAEQAKSEEYQRGVEEERKRLLGERQNQTRRTINGIIAELADNTLSRVLQSTVLGDEGGAQYSLTPEEAGVYLAKIKPELEKAKQGLILQAFSEVRDFMDLSAARLFGDDEEARKAWKADMVEQLDGVDPLNRDAMAMAVMAEHTAPFTKAYKELEASIKKREHDAFEKGSRAGILTGLRAPRGDGPTPGANGVAASAPKEPAHTYDWYINTLTPAGRRAFERDHPEEFKALMKSPEALAKAQR